MSPRLVLLTASLKLSWNLDVFNEKLAIPSLSVVRFWMRCDTDHLSTSNRWSSLSGMGVSLKYTTFTWWITDNTWNRVNHPYVRIIFLIAAKTSLTTNRTNLAFHNWSSLIHLGCINKWKLSYHVRKLDVFPPQVLESFEVMRKTTVLVCSRVKLKLLSCLGDWHHWSLWVWVGR